MAEIIELKNIEINLNTAVQHAAKEIGEEIQDIYETAITKFYGSYSPRMYKRTYSLYEGAKGVGGYGVFQKRISKYNYDCGITVDPSNYSSDPYVKDPPHGLEMTVENVFERSFAKGIHGFTSKERSKMNADKRKGDYGYLKQAPKKLSPPPLNNMNLKFKQIDNFNYVFGKLEAAIDSLGGLID